MVRKVLQLVRAVSGATHIVQGQPRSKVIGRVTRIARTDFLGKNGVVAGQNQ
jgi:hypothetical protein